MRARHSRSGAGLGQRPGSAARPGRRVGGRDEPGLHSWVTEAHGTLCHGEEPSGRQLNLEAGGRGMLQPPALSTHPAPGGLTQGALNVLKPQNRERVGSSKLCSHSEKLRGATIPSLITNKLSAPEPGPRLLCHRFSGTSKTTTKIITAPAAACLRAWPSRTEQRTALCYAAQRITRTPFSRSGSARSEPSKQPWPLAPFTKKQGGIWADRVSPAAHTRNTDFLSRRNWDLLSVLTDRARKAAGESTALRSNLSNQTGCWGGSRGSPTTGESSFLTSGLPWSSLVAWTSDTLPRLGPLPSTHPPEHSARHTGAPLPKTAPALGWPY